MPARRGARRKGRSQTPTHFATRSGLLNGRILALPRFAPHPLFAVENPLLPQVLAIASHHCSGIYRGSGSGFEFWVSGFAFSGRKKAWRNLQRVHIRGDKYTHVYVYRPAVSRGRLTKNA